MIDWVNENWMREVGEPARREPDPVSELIALARGHAVFCRRDIARVVMALRVEFSGHDHPVGPGDRADHGRGGQAHRAPDHGRTPRRIDPPRSARSDHGAGASSGALEGAVIAVAGQAPHDELLAVRAVAGVLGMR